MSLESFIRDMTHRVYCMWLCIFFKCSVLQRVARVAVCCSVLQCVAVCCSAFFFLGYTRHEHMLVCVGVLQCVHGVAVCCSARPSFGKFGKASCSVFAARCSVLQRVAVIQFVAVHDLALEDLTQYVVVCCSVFAACLQRVAVRCSVAVSCSARPSFGRFGTVRSVLQRVCSALQCLGVLQCKP